MNIFKFNLNINSFNKNFQATTILKYWLGGQDPLDYISMYSNDGNERIPPHWHYISMGL